VQVVSLESGHDVPGGLLVKPTWATDLYVEIWVEQFMQMSGMILVHGDARCQRLRENIKPITVLSLRIGPYLLVVALTHQYRPLRAGINENMCHVNSVR